MKKLTPEEQALLGTNPRKFPRNKQWCIDQQYFNSLPYNELLYIGQFNKEFYSGSFPEEGCINGDQPSNETYTRGKKKGQPKSFKTTCYDNNNRSNNDVYSIWNSGSALVSHDDLLTEQDDITSGYNNKREVAPAAPLTLPVRTYTKEEVEAFTAEYNKRNKK